MKSEAAGAQRSRGLVEDQDTIRKGRAAGVGIGGARQRERSGGVERDVDRRGEPSRIGDNSVPNCAAGTAEIEGFAGRLGVYEITVDREQSASFEVIAERLIIVPRDGGHICGDRDGELSAEDGGGIICP